MSPNYIYATTSLHIAPFAMWLALSPGKHCLRSIVAISLISERLQGNANLAVGIFETVRIYTVWMLDAVATMPYVQEALAREGYSHVSPVVESPQSGLTQFLFTQPVMIDGAFFY